MALRDYILCADCGRHREEVMRKCKCEHWQTCPTCYPKGFDTDGNRLPPEETPLQAARKEVAMLRQRIAELTEWNKMLVSHNEQLAQRIDELDECLQSHGIPVKSMSGGVAHYCTKEFEK